MNSISLLLGSNLGESLQIVQQALELIEIRLGKIISTSSIYRTAAWGNINQPDYINQACIFHSEIEAIDALNILLEIEKELGRERLVKWGARLIDIDIIYYNSEIINQEKLIVPHPEMHNRRFVLEPFCEIIPHFVHPILNKTNLKLLEELNDNLAVSKLKF